MLGSLSRTDTISRTRSSLLPSSHPIPPPQCQSHCHCHDVTAMMSRELSISHGRDPTFTVTLPPSVPLSLPNPHDITVAVSVVTSRSRSRSLLQPLMMFGSQSWSPWHGYGHDVTGDLVGRDQANRHRRHTISPSLSSHPR